MRGADRGTVRTALSERDPLPGTCGFAGRLDGTLVRDVLGREPLFVDAAADPPLTDGNWAFEPGDLADPEPVPAGVCLDCETGTADRLWSLPTPDPTTDPARAVDAVRDGIRASVGAVDELGLAVAFSGGVDSAMLAAHLDAPLYVVGFPDSHDVEAARSAADLLARDLRVVELDHDDLRRAVPEVVAATGRTNAMDVQIALPLYLVAERVAADGFDRLAVGQGADELFGGYAKVAGAPEDPRVEADTVRGARREVLEQLPDQLERDALTLRAAGVEPVAPLACDAVVDAALRVPGDLLVEPVAGEPDADTRKVALRRAAAAWLPPELCQRDKKAAQYGSLVARELDRIARQAGFKRRMGDHVRKYVQSLAN